MHYAKQEFIERKIEKLFQLSLGAQEYLARIEVSSSFLLLQFEIRESGEIYSGRFESHMIEEMTSRAGFAKSYQLFTKILLDALGGNKAFRLEFLSFAQVQIKQGVKEVKRNKAMDNKKFLILSLQTQFNEAITYPLNLTLQAATADRLKMTIQRMSLDIQMLKKSSQPIDNKQLKFLKHQNLMLKAKLEKINQTPKFEEELAQLRQERNQLKSANSSLEQQLEKQKTINHKIQVQLQSIKERQKSTMQIQFQRAKKIESEVQDLASQLSRSKEYQKKAKTRIKQLEQQLQAVYLKFKRAPNKEQRQHSVKSVSSKASVRSNQSNKSKKSIRSGKSNSKQPKFTVIAKGSVYDSDTESSRQRRSNNLRLRESAPRIVALKTVQKKKKPKANIKQKIHKVVTESQDQGERTDFIQKKGPSQGKSKLQNLFEMIQQLKNR